MTISQLTLQQRADIRNLWLTERLDTVVPMAAERTRSAPRRVWRSRIVCSGCRAILAL